MPRKVVVHTTHLEMREGRTYVAETLSSHLIDLAYKSFERCFEDRSFKHIHTSADNNWSSHAIAVHLLTHNALEALINELIAIPNMPSPFGEKSVKKWLFDISFLAKYVVVPQLAWQKTFETGKEPYQSLKTLNNLRNHLVHYKMERIKINSLPSGLQLLQDREVLLGPPMGYDWLKLVSSTKTALWALNTAAEVAGKLLAFTSDKVHLAFERHTSNFRFISHEEYLQKIQVYSVPLI